LGWSALFGAIVGAGDAAADKPDAAPVRLALEASGIGTGESVWFVGDTGVDIECARNSRCVSVLLGGEMAEEELARLAPHLVFDDCPALFRFVRGL
jgi:phosphoglycolate phosphatase